MDGLGTRALRRVEDPLDGEVTLGRRRRPQEERLVRVCDMERGAIALGVDADGADAELAEAYGRRESRSPPVGNQNLLEHERAVFSTSCPVR